MVVRNILILMVAMSIQLSGCARKTTGSLSDTKPDETIPEQWTGSYRGIIPCADCPGIETTVTLKQDYSYESSSLYKDRQNVPESKTGRFSLNQNVVTLKSGDGQNKLFLISDSTLVMLDKNGDRISGPLAKHYVLRKENLQNTSRKKKQLASKKWIIKQLGDLPEKDLKKHKTPYIQFDSEKNKVYGNTGCNNFFGTYELGPDDSIIFSGIGATKMFCMETMEIEDAFLDMLSKCKHIIISDSGLVFKDQNNKPIASFYAE